MRSVLRNLTVLAALLFAGAGASFASILATATYSATQISPGTYNYALTLNNTGTTNIGTFWFSWVPGAGFLTATPSAYTSPTGWTFTATNSGAGIRWVTTTDLLAAGSSLTGFGFTSTETPDQLAALRTVGSFTQPGAISYVYEGAPLAGTPSIFVASAVTPEPGTFALVITGLAGVVVAGRRRLLS